MCHSVVQLGGYPIFRSCNFHYSSPPAFINHRHRSSRSTCWCCCQIISYSLNKLIYTIFRFMEHHASSLWLGQSSCFGLPASSNLLSLEIESSLFPAARKMLQVLSIQRATYSQNVGSIQGLLDHRQYTCHVFRGPFKRCCNHSFLS